MIRVEDMTKDFGFGRGAFNVSFEIKEGECFGFLGPNGAGKTTTIRQIMGFSKPDEGQTFINELDTWINASTIQFEIGYLPGEIALPKDLTGREFLKMIADLRQLSSLLYMEYLIDYFEVGKSLDHKKLSLGEKRKLAIVAAFMHNPKILILDEPTSGLDPIMQEKFIKYINEEKKKGKTILLSSHIFAEVDATCDRIAIIKEGHVVSEFVADDLRHNRDKTYQMEFKTKSEYQNFIKKDFHFVLQDTDKLKVKILINNSDVNHLIKEIANYDLTYFKEEVFSLEDYFMQFYAKDKGDSK